MIDLVALIKAIKTAVVQVEEAAQLTNSKGAEKLAAALELIEALVGDISAFLPVIQSIIAILVASYNVRGVFKKTS